MDRRALLRRLARGATQNVPFADMIDLIEGFGFHLARSRGSHRIFVSPAIPELLNLQEVQGQAKPYQIRQFLRLVERHGLQMEDKP